MVLGTSGLTTVSCGDRMHFLCQVNKIVSEASSSVSKIGASSNPVDALAKHWLTKVKKWPFPGFHGNIIFRTV